LRADRATTRHSETEPPSRELGFTNYRNEYLMSHHDYTVSRQIEAENYPFYALIMAAMRKADSENAGKFQRAWPEVSAELNYRYWSTGGLMPGEEGYSPDGDDNLPFERPAGQVSA